MLAGRFDRRVTSIAAGAGFGKTTALAQAFEENRLGPLGIDFWLACGPEDADPERLARGVSASLGLDEAASASELTDTVSEAVGALAPSAVCLVLDDVQFVADTEAAALIDELIDRLPSNGHLLLCGRRLPEVVLTRLELIGEAVTVGEAALAFEAAEASQLLGGDGDVAELGGWPALVRLAGSGRGRRFVEEEVLRSLDSAEREVIRILTILGEADAVTLGALADVDADAVLEQLPLVHRRNDRWAAHDLWADLLGDVDLAVVERVRRGASGLLLESGNASGAVDALAPLPHDVVGAVDRDLVAALRQVLIHGDRTDPSLLRRWARRWPLGGSGEEPAGAAHALLHGLLSRLDNPGGEDCQQLLRSAVDGFERDGDDLAAVAALSALVYSYHVRRDVEGLLWAFGELQRFADAGVASARPFPLLGQALVATSSAAPADVLEHTERLLDMPLGSDLRAITLWLHATAQGNLGLPSVEAAAECYEIGLPVPGMAMIHSGARWRSGLVREMLASPTKPLDGERDRFLTATWEACLHGCLGDVAAAEASLDVVTSSVANASQWQTVGSVTLPTMVVRNAAGRIDEAKAAVDEFLAATPREDQGRFYRWFGMGAIYTLAPGERDWYDERIAAGEAGPFHQRDYALVSAFVAIEERADADAARSVPFPATAGELMPSLGLRNGATVLAAAVGVGRDDVGSLLDDLVDLVGERARSRWRELSDHPASFVADGARTIIESLPVPPAELVELSVLGPTVLRAAVGEVDHPDWRRERVRALLTYLVLHPDANRERVMAALWPEAEEASARRSLRSTLNMLHDVIEPNRLGRDAPFFVRPQGQRLTLQVAPVARSADDASPSDGLFVDVVEFERLVDEGEQAEARGTPSQAVDPYLAAVALYRGDLLPDCYDDWAVFERDRLRSRLVAAGVRAAELLGATGRARQAIETATKVLAFEPWSEPAHRALIAAHLELGDLAAARRALDTCELVLADLGGPSEPQTLELTRRLARR